MYFPLQICNFTDFSSLKANNHPQTPRYCISSFKEQHRRIFFSYGYFASLYGVLGCKELWEGPQPVNLYCRKVLLTQTFSTALKMFTKSRSYKMLWRCWENENQGYVHFHEGNVHFCQDNLLSLALIKILRFLRWSNITQTSHELTESLKTLH